MDCERRFVTSDCLSVQKSGKRQLNKNWSKRNIFNDYRRKIMAVHMKSWLRFFCCKSRQFYSGNLQTWPIKCRCSIQTNTLRDKKHVKNVEKSLVSTCSLNRRDPRVPKKTRDTKITNHIKELVRIQKIDRKMKHRKRDNCRGPLKYCTRNASTHAKTATKSCNSQSTSQFQPQKIVEPPVPFSPTNLTELILPSKTAPHEALQQISTRA